MTIRAASGTTDAVFDATGPFGLQVQGASDPDAARRALRLARVDLVGLGATVSPVVTMAGGPFTVVDLPGASYEVLRQVPDLVLERLRELRLRAATLVAVATGGRLDGFETTRQVAVLRLFPRPAGGATTVPAAWLDLAGEWVAGEPVPGATLRARVLGVESDVAVDAVHDLLHECLVARASCDVVDGDPPARVRTASLIFGRLPHLVLAAGGDDLDSPALLARYELLRGVGRELAPLAAYTCLDFEASLEGLVYGLPEDGWHRLGGASPNTVAARLVDELVPDAFAYQVLGPAHGQRLAIAGVDVAGEPLANGRIELELGSPEDWLRTAVQRDETHAAALELLTPLLVTEEQAEELAAARAHADIHAPPDDEPEMFDDRTDIGAVVLEPAPHAHRGTRMTVLELAASVHHEPHSDRPASVSPVLAAFVRWWAAGVDDSYRQSLGTVAARLPGTAGDADADDRRRWSVASWFVGTHTARWLAAAGLSDAADRLATVGRLATSDDVAESVDLLADAAAAANRRFEITASLAADEAEQSADRRSALEAWESVADAAGWSAASEAVNDGTPADLVDAANLAAMETARAAAAADVAAATWSAAFRAAAADAWDRGWAAADHVARDLTGFTIRVEMGRVAKHSLRSVTHEEGLDLADAAAEEALRDVLLGAGTPGSHPWDGARQAAAGSAGGAAWTAVLDEVERLLGPATWAQAMADARAEVDAALAAAPDRAARAVLVAVAREASGAAARAAALRACAVARANGADDLGAAKAAMACLAEASDDLRARARALVDDLVSPPRAPEPPH